MSWTLEDCGSPEYLDGIRSQYTIKSGNLVVAYAFAKHRAQLAAAAPALLEALEECAPEMRVMSEWASGPTSAEYSEKYARALAAIALAKGESA